MDELGLTSGKPYKKSARIVGEVLGKYHPHGDSSVYMAMVRMAQEWSLRYPLVDGQGNFGSVDGDSAAAMRYTEARMAKITEDMLVDIDKDTVDMMDNFDGSLKEPTVLPTRIPYLLVNGASGIAVVGMATNMPPHNIKDAIDAICAYIDNNDIDIEELIKIIKARIFLPVERSTDTVEYVNPISDREGRVVIRPKTSVEVMPNGRGKVDRSRNPLYGQQSRVDFPDCRPDQRKRKSTVSRISMTNPTGKECVSLSISRKMRFRMWY